MTDLAEALIGGRDDRRSCHRDPARREDPRDPGLRGGGHADLRRADGYYVDPRRSCPSCAGAASRRRRSTGEYSSARRPLDGRRAAELLLRRRLAEALVAATAALDASMKVLTVLGTRPEIIRLSRVIERLDALCEHVLVHTGQNFDAGSATFLRASSACAQPDRYLGHPGGGFGAQVGADHRARSRRCSSEERPDRLLVLGDTDSGLAAFVAKRLGIPRLPHGGRQPLLRRPRARGGQPPGHRPLERRAAALHRAQRGRTCCARASTGQRIFVTGNPINEVLDHHADARSRRRRAFATARRRAGRLLPRDAPPRRRHVDVPSAPASRSSTAPERRGRAIRAAGRCVSVHPRTADRLRAFGVDGGAGAIRRRAARLLRLRRARAARPSACSPTAAPSRRSAASSASRR